MNKLLKDLWKRGFLPHYCLTDDGGGSSGDGGSGDGGQASVVNTDGSFTENWHGKYGDENNAHLSRYKTFDDLVNSHIATKKKLGKNPDSLVEIPTDTSSDEVKAAWRKAKGAPDSIDAYEYTLSDEKAVKLGPLRDDLMTKVKEHANKQDWSPAEFKANLDLYHDIMSDDIDTFGKTTEAETAEAIEKSKAELKQLWLGDYDAKVQRAQSVMEKYGGVEAVAELNLQNSPTLIKFLDNIAGSMSEDTLKGLKGSSGLSTDNINSQIVELRSQQDAIRRESPVNFKSNPKFKDLENRLKGLYQQKPKKSA